MVKTFRRKSRNFRKSRKRPIHKRRSRKHVMKKRKSTRRYKGGGHWLVDAHTNKKAAEAVKAEAEVDVTSVEAVKVGEATEQTHQKNVATFKKYLLNVIYITLNNKGLQLLLEIFNKLYSDHILHVTTNKESRMYVCAIIHILVGNSVGLGNKGFYINTLQNFRTQIEEIKKYLFTGKSNIQLKGFDMYCDYNISYAMSNTELESIQTLLFQPMLEERMAVEQKIAKKLAMDQDEQNTLRAQGAREAEDRSQPYSAGQDAMITGRRDEIKVGDYVPGKTNNKIAAEGRARRDQQYDDTYWDGLLNWVVPDRVKRY